MSDEFRQKLQDYRDGKLTDEERQELEQELEKMELYQEYLDEMLSSEDEVKGTNCNKPSGAEQSMHRKESRILKKGKWKARIGTVFTIIGLYIVFTILSSIGTALYYSAGSPDRSETYRDVLESAVAVTKPNVVIHLSSDSGAYFTIKDFGKMEKRVGEDRIEVGDFSASFFFAFMRNYPFSWSDNKANNVLFQYPGGQGFDTKGEWNRLEKLPEGTVAEVFVSYNHLFTTDEMLKQFAGRNYDPLWFAVDTGEGGKGSKQDVIMDPIGFPSYPIWHPDDGETVTKKEKTGWFTGTESRMTTYPEIDTYGSGNIRNANFVKTLRLLREHKRIMRIVSSFTDIDAAVNYVEKNGVKLYGAVLTGPTKELLKLKDDPAVSSIKVGQVALWNWSRES